MAPRQPPAVGHPSPAIAPPLLAWFERHGRHRLPWQQQPTPYRVWVSEIMLQQTQVSVVIPYFERFMARFPRVADLASAPLDAVLAHWSGLGYYARARHLHRAAQLIVEQYDGDLPARIDTLQTLPGIGRSTAGAILSLALGQRHPILDGNVKRVLARYFAIPGWPGAPAVARQLWTLAEQQTPETRTGAYNQALMDLGATLCVRAAPRCPVCPLAPGCRALASGQPHSFPDPKPRRPHPWRETQLIVAVQPGGEVLLERRPPSGIWGGLWSLPEIAPTDDPADWCRQQLGLEPLTLENLPPRRHTFSHFSLRMRIAVLRLPRQPQQVRETDDWRWPHPDARGDLGLPAPIESLLDALAKAALQRPHGPDAPS